jgi:hypothetical protein
MHAEFNGVRFTDADVVGVDDWFSCQWLRPWLIHDHGFVVCVVFAEKEEWAWDEAANRGKLKSFAVDPGCLADYTSEDDLLYIGDACSPHDVQALTIVELPMPKYSFVACFNKEREDGR